MFKKANITVGPAGSLNELGMVDMPGNYLRCKEADWPFEISFDDGDWLPFDVGMEAKADAGSDARFQRFKIRHPGPSAGEFVFLVGNRVSIGDGRLTISEARNGSAASYVAPILAETVSTVGVAGAVVDSWIQLLPYDANREEAWISTDAETAAYWGLSAAATESASRNLKPTAAEGRWLKLRTKAAIFIRHKEAGKSVTALTFSY